MVTALGLQRSKRKVINTVVMVPCRTVFISLIEFAISQIIML